METKNFQKWNTESFHISRNRSETFSPSKFLNEQINQPPFIAIPAYSQQNISTNNAFTKIIETNQTSSQVDSQLEEHSEMVYGFFIVLGHGTYTRDDTTNEYSATGERNKIFILKKRQQPNGLKATREQVVNIKSASIKKLKDYTLKSTSHTISLCWNSSSRSVIEYELDENLDMFQFGRSTHNDFILSGLWLNKNQPVMSRFSFRVMCDRNSPHACRIYASGFDDTNQLFLGEHALKWHLFDGPIHSDGFITNGILIKFPDSPEWKEVSTIGQIYDMRSSQQILGNPQENMNNILKDNTLISCGGVNFLWKSGKPEFPTDVDIQRMTLELNAIRAQCPVGLETIRFSIQSDTSLSSSAWVFPACGHVHGHHLELEGHACPICRQEGPYTSLKFEKGKILGVFCKNKPEYCFNPCGHIVDKEGALLWSTTPIPQLNESVQQRPSVFCCPFCRTRLSLTKPFSKLIFS